MNPGSWQPVPGGRSPRFLGSLPFLGSLALAVLAVVLSVPLVGLLPHPLGAPTDYETELAETRANIAALEQRPGDAGRATLLPQRRYQLALLTGLPADLAAAKAAVERAIAEAGPLAELYLLKTSLDLRVHWLDAAAQDLAALRRFAGHAQVAALTATLAFQRGDYASARTGYLSAIEKDPAWDHLARLAHWESKFGDLDVADRLYEQAQQRVAPKDKRSWAWLSLERGLLAFNRGRYGEAAAHYAQAGQTYSGFWLVDEHMAELLGAERKFDRAAPLYERVLARVPRPELQQAFGDLLRAMGREAEAKPWHDRALAGYLESVERGEVHYYHHLAGFYADVRHDGAAALAWARKDVELRPSFLTTDALAWALYRDGQFAGALQAARQALAAGANDVHLFFHAAMIHLAAGETAEGKRLLERVARLNPGYENFHVHR